jgi:ribosome-binding factor A
VHARNVRRRANEHGAHAPFPRTARLNQVLREVVADALERLADIDERLRLVTVTGVDIASDLSHATVYLSALDEQTAEALEELRPELQQSIGRQVRMKRTPRLHFAADPAVAHAMRVEEILRKMHEGRASGGEDERDDGLERGPKSAGDSA